MKFNEHDTQPYDWDAEGVYIIEPTDPVEGGPDGVSNCQAKELTRRTRNLHTRMTTAEGEIDTLQEQTPLQVAAALASANTYTDGKDTVLRSDMAIADTAAIRAAKDYADQVVAALVDNSPEALNTLQELAKALGGDPNFATTVMQAIGERMKTVDVNNALAGKLNAEGETVLSGEASAIVIENTGAGGLGTRRASVLLRWYNQFAGISVLRGSGVDVYALGININNDIVAKFSRENLMIGNNTVYHSGNFDPGAKANKAETICWKDEGAHLNPDNLKETGYYFVYTPGAGTILVIAAFPGGGHPMQIFVPYNYSGIRTRSFNTDAQIWSPWVEMYHSGNLGAATTGAAGLMSPADKTKLDGMSTRVLAAGIVGSGGGFNKKIGPFVGQLSVLPPATEGVYRIAHNFQSTLYTTTITPCERYGGQWSLSASVIAETSTYIDVVITENEFAKNSAFNFIIVGTL